MKTPLGLDHRTHVTDRAPSHAGMLTSRLRMAMAAALSASIASLLVVEVTAAAGVSTRRLSSGIHHIAAGKVGGAKATCPDGYQVSGGGYIVWDNNLVVVKNAPAKTGEVWEVEALSPKNPGRIEAYILCVKLVP